MAFDRQERINYLKALEDSLERKKQELIKLQEANTKVNNMQGTRDSIARQSRLILKIKRELGLA
jgi:acyl-CoA reductase-like NAD-dependent aldehyde dehydrogenase